jgi:hypothetical protein
MVLSSDPVTKIEASCETATHRTACRVIPPPPLTWRCSVAVACRTPRGTHARDVPARGVGRRAGSAFETSSDSLSGRNLGLDLKEGEGVNAHHPPGGGGDTSGTARRGQGGGGIESA